MTVSRRLLDVKRHLRSSARALSITVCLTVQALSVAHADDTEIFFSQAEGDPSTHPNIVFILDNSGSMRGRVSGGSQSKMAAMQEAMNEIIDNVQDINLGLVNFKVGDWQRGSRMVYPVTHIDTPGARQAMKNVVNAMSPRTATPLVGALYESAMIMRGGNIEETSATYSSPMIGECQNNHIVMLSDGQAWGNNAISKTQNLIGRSCASSGWWGSETCGVELADWLNNTDHSSSLSNVQDISVSTIGFNISSSFLDRVATAGGGEYYEASRSDELVAVFNEIITTVKDIDTTFVAPATSINQFNRLTQSNDLYFSMFKPQSSTSWPGNLKRFQLAYESGNLIIADANGNAAVDPATGIFKETSKSFWSDVQDGADVQLGGAAAELVSTARTIYTHLGSIPSGGVDLVNVLSPNSSVITTYLGGYPAFIRDLVVRWVKGEDVLDEVPGLERRHMGDILHSSPVTVNYNGKSLVYVGTNEGFLHAINRDDGREEFSFIPQELVSNLIEFYSNNGASTRPYGLDGDIALRHEDNNGDSIVNGSDKAILYIGMRRGGNDYYALDVTNPDRPKLLWHIDGGVGDFARLGQTWSKPISTDIQYRGNPTSVLIFGGGYDTNQDPENNPNGTDSVGNTVYIVDADSGRKIWSAYDNTSGVSSSMRYSIPSDLRVIDINGDTYADRIYVGDMGGLLWRFDLKPYHQASDGVSQLVTGGLIANLRSGGTRTRFFNEPDVALISHEGVRFMSVSVGSGWRAHPLSETEDDYFFMVRDNNPLITPQTYDSVTASELTDVTKSLSSDASRNGDVDMEGWKLRLTSNGEKNLSRSITVNNQVLFSSYAPIASTDVCSPPSGQGFVYAVDVVHGDPVLPLTTGGAGGSSLSVSDRKKVLATESIPPGPTAAIAEVGGEIRTSVMVGAETPLNALPFSDLTKRTYWQDRRRGNATPASCRAGSC